MKTLTVTTVNRNIQGINAKHYGVIVNGKEISLIQHPAKNPLLSKLTLQELAEYESKRILNS